MDLNEMIVQKGNVFVINTEHTTYAMRVMEEIGYLEHLYYGRRIHMDDADGLWEQHAFQPGNSIVYNENTSAFTLEDVCLEMSALGKGDIREPFIEVVNADGSSTLDFKFKEANIVKGKVPYRTLPGSYDENDEVMQLHITMKDEYNKLTLKLVYSVFALCDVITRSAEILNEGDRTVRLKRFMSNLIDFDRDSYVVTSFHGTWAREMKRYDVKLNAGKYVNSSFTGTSSNRSNPFIMLSRENTSEVCGECYGFNLVYSGNHYEAVEVNGYGKTRIVQGINPQNFEYILEPGDDFEAPEAVMTYACEGFNSLSRNMHKFVREHIVRGKYKHKVRPILINSWEAAYFDINKSKLIKLAKEGKELGIELFVMDDGWFGERNDDSHSLGDWDVNEKKLPGGIKALADSINNLGMDFGIWVEPEMINVHSKLYKAHPEWAMDIPGKAHSEGRNQRVLDLTRDDVRDHIIEKMTSVLNSANISYVKWDMNRIITDYYSKALDEKHQGEVGHRYVLGLYKCLDELTKRFPDILFEGCASGGNRFDLGMLCYCPQIWASDNTDAVCRAEIQNNYTYGYPPSVISAHVSGVPNHQTLRRTPLSTRYHVACFGLLGYECNLCDLKKEEKEAIASQIEEYKKHRELFQFGDFYRGRSFGNGVSDGSVLSENENNLMEWTVVSPDKKQAAGIVLQKEVHPNSQCTVYKADGLKEDAKYKIRNRRYKFNIKDFGDLINTIAPVHIKQDSFVHNVAAHFVKMDNACEEHVMYGDALMYAGVKLKQAFSGTGYSEDVRMFKDFESEMFFMEEQ